jgi:hypothetical protein
MADVNFQEILIASKKGHINGVIILMIYSYLCGLLA